MYRPSRPNRIAFVALACAGWLLGQQRETAALTHAARIADLAKHLRWHGQAEGREYVRIRDDVTSNLLTEIDGVVTDSFRPGVQPGQVRSGLDALLGYKEGDGFHNVAFVADIAGEQYLIVGVELWRGPEVRAPDSAAAPTEPPLPDAAARPPTLPGEELPGQAWGNAISFRAYRATGDRLIAVGNQGFAVSDDPDHVILCCLTATVLATPVSGEFWFAAWAQVVEQSPPIVAFRVYAFDGKTFRTVWAAKDFMAESVLTKAIDVTSNGFVLNRLFDPTGHAAHSPGIVIHEQYALTPNGPQKVTEWTTDRQ